MSAEVGGSTVRSGAAAADADTARARGGASQVLLPLDRFRRLLAWVLGLVIYAGLTVEFAALELGLGDLGGLRSFLSLSQEENLPTWLSACLLFSCAAVLALIARDERRRGARFVRHWWALSLIFLYISLDETAMIHESANRWFDLSGALYFGWVIPAGIAVVLVGLSYLRFLAALPERTRWGFVRAGAVYVGGALGVELALGWWADHAGDENFVYALIDLVEESLEMIGASLFLVSLLEYLGGVSGELRISFAPAASSPPEDCPPADGGPGGR
jgi:hypothetical protein